MKTSDFYFDLPQELIAQDPLEDRSSSGISLGLATTLPYSIPLAVSTITWSPFLIGSFFGSK